MIDPTYLFQRQKFLRGKTVETFINKKKLNVCCQTFVISENHVIQICHCLKKRKRGKKRKPSLYVYEFFMNLKRNR